jgi:hypothetical protein
MDTETPPETDTTEAHAPCEAPPTRAEARTGSWSWDLLQGHWFWSDEMYAIHGFQPGDVVPSTELILAHKHLEDLEKCRTTMAQALERGGRFSCYHRIIDARTRTRHVLTVGEARTDAEGEVTELTGYMVDLTPVRRDDFESAISEAITAATGSRSTIELAKGALMSARGIDQDAAFALLRKASNDHNRKLNDIAHDLVTRLSSSSTTRDPALLDLLASQHHDDW